MPKIDAPTVAEHHARVKERLVDAAEEILRSGEQTPLTAGAVSASAGIARNSIYRYVDSVDDLRGMVIARHLPAWQAAVDEAVERADGPGERLVAWVRTNLEQAAQTGHGWLMAALRAPGLTGSVEVVERAHALMREVTRGAWLELLDGDTERAEVASAITLGAVDSGFRRMDAGTSPDVVIELCTQATQALVTGLGTPAAGGDSRAAVSRGG